MCQLLPFALNGDALPIRQRMHLTCCCILQRHITKIETSSLLPSSINQAMQLHLRFFDTRQLLLLMLTQTASTCATTESDMGAQVIAGYRNGTMCYVGSKILHTCSSSIALLLHHQRDLQYLSSVPCHRTSAHCCQAAKIAHKQ